MSLFDEYVRMLDTGSLLGASRCRELSDEACRLIERLPEPKNVLEIGRSHGFSFGFFRYLWPEAFVVSVDIVPTAEAKRIADLFLGPYLFVTGDSSCVLCMDLSFDLVLIDGDHSYAGCKFDWLNIQSNLHLGSIVLFDDLPHRGGCGKVFRELESSGVYHTQTIRYEGKHPKRPAGVECMGMVTI